MRNMLKYIFISYMIFLNMLCEFALSQSTKQLPFCDNFFDQEWSRNKSDTEVYLLNMVKRRVIEDIIPSYILRSMTPKERTGIKDSGTEYLRDIEKNYINGDRFGELCIQYEGLISPIDESIFKLNPSEKEYCSEKNLGHPKFEDLAMRGLIEDVVKPLDIGLESSKLEGETIKKLVRNRKIVESYTYNPSREKYCIKIRGDVYPLQVKFYMERDDEAYSQKISNKDKKNKNLDAEVCDESMIRINLSVENFFCFDSREVTNKDYQKNGKINDGNPKVNITWDDANVYCMNRGGRLPTEKEWDIAVKGGYNGVKKIDNDIKEWVSDRAGSDNKRKIKSIIKDYDTSSFSHARQEIVGFRCVK